jgi:hypothetical protein
MASVITLQGIDRAISNLNYRSKKSLKYRLVNAIRQFYTDQASVDTIREIDVHRLAKTLWDAQDAPETTQERRKSLRRIRYSVNADLRKLYNVGKNPEGIVIGPTNVFAMSAEAKDEVLKALLADREGLMGADLAELMRDYQAPEDLAHASGVLVEAESTGEIMMEEEIFQAIKELDEGGVIGTSEQDWSAEDLREAALAEEKEEPALVQAPVAEAEDELGGVRTEELVEKGVEEEDLGEISFDPEETQYLSIPEEGETLGQSVDADTLIDEDTEKFEESDLGRTAEPEKGSAGKQAEGELGGVRTEELVEEGVEEEDLGEISFDAEETQYLSASEDERKPVERVDEDTEKFEESDLGRTAEPEKGPTDVKTLRRRAIAKEKSRNFKAALDLYQRILELSPGDEKAEEACLRLSLKLIDKES